MKENLILQNYYSILEISRYCKQEEIRPAYLKKIKKYHPDINKLSNANDIMKILNEAYEVLNSSDMRELYNEKYDDIFLRKESVDKEKSLSDNEITSDDMLYDFIIKVRKDFDTIFLVAKNDTKNMIKIILKEFKNILIPLIILLIILIIFILAFIPK